MIAVTEAVTVMMILPFGMISIISIRMVESVPGGCIIVMVMVIMILQSVLHLLAMRHWLQVS